MGAAVGDQAKPPVRGIAEPRPYVPPDARPTGPDPAGHRKPWMSLPDNHQRCWRCGVLIVDPTALAAHEDGPHPSGEDAP